MEENRINEKQVSLDVVNIGETTYLKILNCDAMRPFFMSIVSDSDHWMFISSNGGLTAGRKNADFALFPYYTDDKITDMADLTGSKTVLQVHRGDDTFVWEPMSDHHFDRYEVRRHLYKSIYGNKVIFEEVNENLGLVFSYSWSPSEKYGFVRESNVKNISGLPIEVTVLDGIQNILPYGVHSDLQNGSSNLVDAYKRNELHKASGLGIFALSAIIVDKAEPSEALKANIVWSVGLEGAAHLLSSRQIEPFRRLQPIHPEEDVKGEKGAYFIHKKLEIEAGVTKSWKIIADVNKNHSQVALIIKDIEASGQLMTQIDEDVRAGTVNLKQLICASDGIQITHDKLQDCRHYSNVLFNIMRGGIFDHNYQIEKADFVHYMERANIPVSERNRGVLESLKSTFGHIDLIETARSSEDSDFIRLAIEYLPLKFSRRHGDPSRPWNKFSINIKDERDGSKVLDYEGNWRDIFQNWEALAYSYPEFIDAMIYKFLNASTFDGYNPYRVTKDGFDWETIEPDDPWSYIGYWGDHQIIYLQKFLEIIEKFQPGRLQALFPKEDFVYAAVPYVIKSYSEITNNPKDTINFDAEWDKKIRENRNQVGADGGLLIDNNGEIYHVNFLEKIMASILAKLVNFIPEGGIWMNTQRPEWNDANNALVGNGVSMVTLYYLRRMLHFFSELLSKADFENIQISSELVELYHSVREVFEKYESELAGGIDDKSRKEILDALGQSGSDYRHHIYTSGFWGKKRTISKKGLEDFFRLSLTFVDHTISKGQRQDHLFHAYNLMTYAEDGVTISHLDEMLEGQVAALSSGYLDARTALEVLDSMKSSSLFRPDQYSYILYPNKNLPGFLERNTIDKTDAESSILIQSLIKDNNKEIVEQDINGHYHFHGNFKNAGDLKKALETLANRGYDQMIKKEQDLLTGIFEKVFNHKSFTGRSGTFYAYEGLGSIYWHMVSKLLLSIQECCLEAEKSNADALTKGKLLDHYYEVQAGIGVHKSPDLYGAFPTDPYSHTPMHRGAQQPGMTGQVKEDILARISELGIFIEKGCLNFNPTLLRKNEFLEAAQTVDFVDIHGQWQSIEVEKGQLFFSYCQVPVIYTLSSSTKISLRKSNNSLLEMESNTLDHQTSQSIFRRTGEVQQVEVFIDQNKLK